MQIKFLGLVTVTSLLVIYSHRASSIEKHANKSYENSFLSDTPLAEKAVNNRAAELDEQQQRRQQERERLLQQNNSVETDVRLDRPATNLPPYPDNESSCFTIRQIDLQGEAASQFQWALKSVNDAKGRCLGGQGHITRDAASAK